MSTIEQRLRQVRARITEAETLGGRTPGSVRLLAVSKSQPVAELEEAIRAGQTAFGESYLQEALAKIEALGGEGLEWHFIGPIQSNKTALIAQHFDWVHSVDRVKIAQRLHDQRPSHLPPLNVCIQVNISQESTKSGVSRREVTGLASAIANLSRLRLRGLMTIPAPQPDAARQREPFRVLHQLLDELNRAGYQLDTLSMGMSDDMQAAILEGATIVRIGTALFGPRS